MASSSALHTPFAQAYTGSSSSSSSRTSPFQQASAAAGLAETDDPESAWVASTYGARLRQRYLDVFEPMGPAPARSSSAGRVASSSRALDYDQQQPRNNIGSRAGTPAQLRIVLAEDDVAILSSSGSTQQQQPHIIRAHAILTTSNSARLHHVSPPRLQASNSMDSAAARRSSSSGSNSSVSNSNSGTSLRRLQRRSSSLLAATSATASNLWSAFSDRSRALLCRNSPVTDGTGQHGSSDGTQSRSSSDSGSSRRNSSSSEPGSSIRVLPLGPGVAAPMAVVGSPVGSSIVRVPGRLSQRLLLRSTAIRRSAGARSPAVLIDVDATDSYDDLLALDQFNVKRAVRASVLKGLPCRTPSMQDAQQQRQCHICFDFWLPPEACDADDTAAAADSSSAGCSGVAGQQGCCQCCALYPQQQRQQHAPQLPPLLDGQQQHVLDRLQLLCWDGPVGLHGSIIPAPAPARLMGGFDDLLAADSDDVGRGGLEGDAPSGSSSSSRDGDSRQRPGVQGWTSMAAGEAGGASAGHGQQVLRQAGHNRVEAAAAGRALASPAVSAAGVPVSSAGGSGAGASHADSSAAGGRASGAQRCSCRRAEDSVGAAVERRKAAAAGVQIQRLPCGHEFCSGCIQTWLKEHISCPVCRWTFPEVDTRLINK